MTDLLLATRSYPPAIGGSANLLYEFLRHFPEPSIAAVCGQNSTAGHSGQVLPFRSEQVLTFRSRWLTPRLARRFPERYISAVERRIVALARHEKAERIYAHYPDAVFAVAAYRAAERLDLPLAIYYDILWEERGDRPDLARLYERRICERADKRFAITEYAASHLEKKLGRHFEVMPHVAEPAPHDRGPAASRGRHALVHFAGGIYPRMNSDAVVRLATVVASGRCDADLELFTPVATPEIEALRGTHGRIEVRYAPRSEMYGHQRRADILYVPQAFESSQPEMIRCNFPTKVLEYMRAGRPILVHSPPGSYLSDAARRDGWAVVVDEPDEVALARGLQRLIDDPTTRRSVVEAADTFLRSRDARRWAEWFHTRLTTDGAETQRLGPFSDLP